MFKGKLFKSFIFVLVFLFIMSSLPVFSVQVNAASAYPAGKVTTASGQLNIRSSATTSSAVLSRLKNGSFITLISKNGLWWKVKFGEDKFGYCHSSYISPVTSSKNVSVSTLGGSLNVRTGPSTSYPVKTKLKNGSDVVKISDHGNFSRILYDGTQIGYVSSNYIKSRNTSEIRLSVPDYKQTDPRWSDIKLGSSGKTIGSIGCTTTALAMAESYRKASVITPDAMSRRLTYSSSGSLYWPSDYTAVTNSKDYLYTIRGLLQKGKPVIIGCKKNNGSQHWVVVTGYNGGSVKAQNFYINDPGSKSRNTLDEFLSIYPNFHKIVYYV